MITTKRFICFAAVGFGLIACEGESSRRLPPLDASTAGSVDAATLETGAADAHATLDGLNDAGHDAGNDTGGSEAGLPVEAIEGYYSGQWGNLLLRQVGDEVWGAYTHDQGTIVGTYQDGVLVGWWSEHPSRLPTGDAGDVEFRFLIKDGKPFIDGRWKYGSAEAWRENWDIAWVDAEPPAPLVQRFLDPTVFKRKPAM